MEKKILEANQFVKAGMVINAIVLVSLLFLPFRAYALDAGDRTPDFHIVTPDGKEISYDRDIRDKKPLYLVFWATW